MHRQHSCWNSSSSSSSFILFFFNQRDCLNCFISTPTQRYGYRVKALIKSIFQMLVAVFTYIRIYVYPESTSKWNKETSYELGQVCFLPGIRLLSFVCFAMLKVLPYMNIVDILTKYVVVKRTLMSSFLCLLQNKIRLTIVGSSQPMYVNYITNTFSNYVKIVIRVIQSLLLKQNGKI